MVRRERILRVVTSTAGMPHAFNIRLDDARVHAYAQRYCFLNRPDVELNARLREVVIASTRALPEERDASRIEFVSRARNARSKRT